MEDKEEKLRRSVRSAAASVWLEKLPLSKEFVEEYLEQRLSELRKENNNDKKLVLKRGD
jgi:hypothetical protein